MKKILRLLSIILMPNILSAQSCDCTSFPISPKECVIYCLKNANVIQLQSGFHFDKTTAAEISKIPRRDSFSSVEEFKRKLPSYSINNFEQRTNIYYTIHGDYINGDKRIIDSSVSYIITNNYQTNINIQKDIEEQLIMLEYQIDDILFKIKYSDNKNDKTYSKFNQNYIDIYKIINIIKVRTSVIPRYKIVGEMIETIKVNVEDLEKLHKTFSEYYNQKIIDIVIETFNRQYIAIQQLSYCIEHKGRKRFCCFE